MAIVELVRLKLRPGVDPPAFLAASERFSAEVAPFVPGMQRRELCQTSDDEYLLLVRFASQQHLDEMKNIASSMPAASAFSSLIDMSAMSVEVHQIVSEYSGQPA